jgi:hypothetical protein
MGETNNAATLFSNPNFLALLAGIGTQVDPQGVGGQIGRPTTQYIQNVAAQEAIEKQEQERRRYNEQLIGLIGGLTPKGVTGPSQVTINPEGYTAKVELPGGGAAVADLPNRDDRTSLSRAGQKQLQLSDIVPFY